MGLLRLASLALILTAAQAPPGAVRSPEAVRIACLSNPETREAIIARRAIPPFRAVAQAMHEGGDLVAIRLCRSADPPLVYDVAVLRRDGRLVHVIVDAATGTILPGHRGPNDIERKGD